MRGQLLDFRIVGGERPGAALFQGGDVAFQRRDDALGQADQAFDAAVVFHCHAPTERRPADA